MTTKTIVRRLKPLSPIVEIVITHATRRRANGGIPQRIFEAQIARLAREELEPKGLELVECCLPGGRTRFVVKETATGQICTLMDFTSDGTLEQIDRVPGAAPCNAVQPNKS